MISQARPIASTISDQESIVSKLSGGLTRSGILGRIATQKYREEEDIIRDQTRETKLKDS